MDLNEFTELEKETFDKLKVVASEIDKRLDDYLGDYKGTNKSLMKLIQVICCIESVLPLRTDQKYLSPFDDIYTALYTLLVMIYEEQYKEVKAIFNEKTALSCITDAKKFDPLITTHDFQEIISNI